MVQAILNHIKDISYCAYSTYFEVHRAKTIKKRIVDDKLLEKYYHILQKTSLAGLRFRSKRQKKLISKILCGIISQKSILQHRLEKSIRNFDGSFHVYTNVPRYALQSL